MYKQTPHSEVVFKGVTDKQMYQASVSQPPGRGLVPGPGINYTGPREFLEFIILVF